MREALRVAMDDLMHLKNMKSLMILYRRYGLRPQPSEIAIMAPDNEIYRQESGLLVLGIMRISHAFQITCRGGDNRHLGLGNV